MTEMMQNDNREEELKQQRGDKTMIETMQNNNREDKT